MKPVSLNLRVHSPRAMPSDSPTSVCVRLRLVAPEKVKVKVPVHLMLESPIEAYRNAARAFEIEEAKSADEPIWDTFDWDD